MDTVIGPPALDHPGGHKPVAGQLRPLLCRLPNPNASTFSAWSSITNGVRFNMRLNNRRPLPRSNSLRRASIVLVALLVTGCDMTEDDLSDSIGAEVAVTGGTVRGLVAGEGAHSLKQYHGIPYAAPPLGSLRWAPPAAVVPWQSVLDATRRGAFCTQPQQAGVGFYITKRTDQSEDCLTINVWTRADRVTERRPVMFWVHGGGLQGGAGFEQTGELLTEQGAVLVTFNYRLGRMGFLAHPELSAENPKGVSGNQGFRDQIAALHWVHRNIEQFGGDPDNITIFGESAGSTSVSALQASPMARGLFHRAIGQSGAAFHPLPDRLVDKAYAPAGETVGKMFARALVGETGDASLAALRALPAERIVEVAQSSPVYSTYESLPIVDGEVLPDEIANIFARGEQADVPTLIGSNADEGAAVMEHFTGFLGEGVEGFTRFKMALLGEATDDIDALYPVDNPRGVMQSWQDLFADITFTYPMRRWARDMANVESDVYLYWFTWHPPVEGRERYRSFHGADLGYVFGQLTLFGAKPTEADREFSELIAETWIRFAVTGNPNGGPIEGWQAFTPENEAYFVLGPDLRSASSLRLPEMTLIENAWRQRREAN